MNEGAESSRELLAEARAIHLAMRHGQITYEQAKILTQPLLSHVNERVKSIAKECNVKPKYVKFQDLGIQY